MLIKELRRIAATSDEGGRRAANACLAMLNFAATFAEQLEESPSERTRFFAQELNRHLREAALGQIATEELVQHAIATEHGPTFMASLGGNDD